MKSCFTYNKCSRLKIVKESCILPRRPILEHPQRHRHLRRPGHRVKQQLLTANRVLRRNRHPDYSIHEVKRFAGYRERAIRRLRIKVLICRAPRPFRLQVVHEHVERCHVRDVDLRVATLSRRRIAHIHHRRHENRRVLDQMERNLDAVYEFVVLEVEDQQLGWTEERFTDTAGIKYPESVAFVNLVEMEES